jgi:hypothetical protein
MKVLYSPKSEIVNGAQNNYNWKGLENEKTDLLFAYGIDAGYRMERPTNFKYKIYIEAEEPNGFRDGKLPQDRGNWEFDYWTKIFHTCPYTAKWENMMYNTDKFVCINYPCDPSHVIHSEKLYTACYIGGIRQSMFHQIAEIVSSIPNHRIVSYCHDPIVTNHNVSYFEKLKINSQCKISVVANLLQVDPNYLNSFKTLPRWQENEALSSIDCGYIPQIKNRVIEAGLTKSLVLVLKDPWNVIENFYKPDEHFIYFEHDNLKDKIQECLSNWSYCEKIIENMYKFVMDNYTLQITYDRYFKQYDT